MRKFYATLPHKLDAEVQKVVDQLPENEIDVEFSEVLEGETPLGGEMRLNINFKNKNNP